MTSPRKAAVADEGCGDADEGGEVFGLALVAAVQASAAGQPGHRVSPRPSGGGPAVARTRCLCGRCGGGCPACAAIGAGGRSRIPCRPSITPTTTAAYDTDGRLTAATDADNTTTHYAYDTDGETQSETGLTGAVTQTTHDAALRGCLRSSVPVNDLCRCPNLFHFASHADFVTRCSSGLAARFTRF